MNRNVQYLKRHSLFILISIILSILLIIVFNQKVKIKNLKIWGNEFRQSKSVLESENRILINALYECKSDKEYYKNKYRNQNSDNDILVNKYYDAYNKKEDFEREIRRLEDELESCQSRLRDCKQF